jgi:hypothetical protein
MGKSIPSSNGKSGIYFSKFAKYVVSGCGEKKQYFLLCCAKIKRFQEQKAVVCFSVSPG